MSVKGNRNKNLGTLVECSENGDDSVSLMLNEEAVEDRPAAITEGLSTYETASSKYSVGAESAEGVLSRNDIPSPAESTDVSIARHIRHSSDATSKSRSDTSPKHRKTSSGVSVTLSHSSSEFSGDTAATPKAMPIKLQQPAAEQPKPFSLRSFLNNMTAPVRRPKRSSHKGSNTSSTSNPTATTPTSKHSRKKDKSVPKTGNPEAIFKNRGQKASAKVDVEVHQESDDNPLNRSDRISMSFSDADYYQWAYARIFNTNAGESSALRDCQLCYNAQPSSSLASLTNCLHRPCRSCLLKYLQVEIMESRVLISCPECTESIHPNDLYAMLSVLNPQLLQSYERFMLRRVLMLDPDTRWCPAPDCDFAVIASSCAACPKLECHRPGCGTLFCYHCKGEWHANQTCDEARGKSMERMLASAASKWSSTSTANGGPASANAIPGETFKSGDLKACPRCRTFIVKMNDGSCNHMVCPICQADFCWLCLKEISDLHYLSPTGCTFWGKKPWTRKKKLLWQIGTLIGAPVGIALIAGLAIPGIICGVPVLVGRKVFQRFPHMSKTRRRLLTAASVAGSLIVSPVLAVMAVGVGVPIMLAYVYGVVPLSLCRNGGCGGGGGDSATLEDLVEDEEEFVNISAGLRGAFVDEEHSRLLQKHFDGEKLDGTSVATGVSTNSGFSLNALPGTSAAVAGPSGGRYGSQGHAVPAEAVTPRGGALNVHSEKRKRKMSVESCVNSIGEKLNYENASTKANAGSHYHFDNKSVHTVYSGTGVEVQSYCEENASVQAMSGSIDGKSLGDTGSVRLARQYRTNSRPERDISPSSVLENADLYSRAHSSADQQAVIITALTTIETEDPELGGLPSSKPNAPRDPFKVRSLMDNIRQILRDDDPSSAAAAAVSALNPSSSAQKKLQSKREIAHISASHSQHRRTHSIYSPKVPESRRSVRLSMPLVITSNEPQSVIVSSSRSSHLVATEVASMDSSDRRHPDEGAFRRFLRNVFL